MKPKTVYRLLILVATFAAVAPLGWTFLYAISSHSGGAVGALGYGDALTLDHFLRLFDSVPFDGSAGGDIAKGFREALATSLAVAGGSAAIAVITGFYPGLLIGYAQARKWLYLRIVLGFFILPVVALVEPLLRLLVALQLYDTTVGLILVYAALSVPLVVGVIGIQSLSAVRRLNETASLDGMSPRLRMWTIDIPHLLPAIVLAWLLSFLVSWGELVLGLVLTASQVRTASLVLAGFQTLRGVHWGLVSAATIVMLVPALLIWALVFSSESLRSRVGITRTW